MNDFTRVRFAARVAAPFALAAVAALGLGAEARAQTGPRVDVAIKVEQEITRTDPTGKKTVERQPVQVATPGDVLVYTLQAVNRGQAPALDSRLDDPIPAGTVLVPGTATTEGARVAASLDGGRSWLPYPVEVIRVDDKGRERREPAPPDSYTHLRWQFDEPLAPGEARTVSFKVRVR